MGNACDKIQHPKSNNWEDAVKRNMDLIRILLLKIDENPEFNGSRTYYGFPNADLGNNDYSQNEIAYHLNLLIEAGLIDGEADPINPPAFRRLTWAGHDFVDSVRNETVWKKAKDIIISKGGSFTMKILSEIISGLLKQLYGLP